MEETKEEEVKLRKSEYFKCPSCKGTGRRLIESHDCWGRDDSYKGICGNCSGNGFQLTLEAMRRIRKRLDI